MKTETGIDITNYITAKEQGLIAITKPLKASGNYVVVQTSWTLAPGPDGKPVPVEGDPVISNINRQSLAAVEKQLADDEARIANARAQLAAIASDMDTLDAE